MSWVVKAEAHHIGRRWKRSRPSRTELAFGLCEVRFGDGDIRGQGFVACQSGKKTSVRATKPGPKRAVAVCLAPSSGELEGPLDDESGRRAKSRVLVFDMWIADVGQTHLWLVGCASPKGT